MFRLVAISAFIGLALCFPAAAALEAHDGYAAKLADASIGTDPMSPIAICVPPEPQYIPDFIRNLDGTIVGIKYTILDYVC